MSAAHWFKMGYKAGLAIVAFGFIAMAILHDDLSDIRRILSLIAGVWLISIETFDIKMKALIETLQIGITAAHYEKIKQLSQKEGE